MYLYAGYIGPFVLLIIFNCGIIYEATKYSRRIRIQQASQKAGPRLQITSNSLNKKAEMSKTILLVTFIYILIASPSAIYSGYFYADLVNTDYGPMINNIFDAIIFSYPAFNFFILYFSNKKFHKEVREWFVWLKTRRRVTNHTSNTSNTQRTQNLSQMNQTMQQVQQTENSSEN